MIYVKIMIYQNDFFMLWKLDTKLEETQKSSFTF